MGQRTSCVICERFYPNGLFLLDMYICPRCEQAMITTEADDPAYRIFAERLKHGCSKMNVVQASG